MRLIFLCSALCVASPTYAVSPEYSPEAMSLGRPGFGSHSGWDPAGQCRPSRVANSGRSLGTAFIVQPRPEEVEQEPSGTSLSNASGQEERKFTKTELCSAAASVAAANNLPVPFFANLISTRERFQTPCGQPRRGAGYRAVHAAGRGFVWPRESVRAAFCIEGVCKTSHRPARQVWQSGLAAAAYNAGPKRVQDWMARRRKLPAETRQYVHRITGRPAEQWARRRLKDTEARLPPHARCPDVPAVAAPDNEAIKPANQIARIESASKPRTPFRCR